MFWFGPPPMFRPAQPGDVPAILSLWEEILRDHSFALPGLRGGPEHLRFFRETLDHRLRQPGHRVIVAERRSRVIGYIALQLATPPPAVGQPLSAEIAEIAVARPFRQHGVGTCLVREATAWLRQLGGREITCQVVPENQPARRFWDKLGFSPCAGRLRRPLA